MGDCGGFGGDGNGVVVMGMGSRSPSPSPDPLRINEECWAAAEETAQEVLNWIHPTLDSEEKRKDVIDYVQRLIRDSLGCEVFPYGSVPLKTYLPDGDIDLTALSRPNVEEFLPQDVLAVLQEEEQNENAEYQVKDTQFIDAEVKLVKCLVQNIVIDISFNQLGGLCTLCFLEQVDRLVGKDHLFKRSILLVKSWCYYESRILGAHHGLISTYALETLVLYIFHLFHSSLNGPLMVLYRFLDYFSKFDWDNYCISLNGPVCKSNLPNIVVEKPDNGGNELMLSEEFQRNCMEMFSVPCRGPETSLRTFPPKHLNIIDPLKEYNNLGRSVHRGNFYRIRSAFKYGARKLGRILSLPRDRIADEIKDFYANTLVRHGRKYGRDIGKPILVFGAEGYLNLSSSSPAEVLSEDDVLLNGDFENDSIGVENKCTSLFSDELNKYSTAVVSSPIVSEGCYLADGAAVSGHRLLGDANDLSSSNSQRSGNGSSDCLGNHGSSLSGHRAPLFCPSKSCKENGNLKVGSSCRADSSDGIGEKVGFDVLLEQRENCYVNNTYLSCMDKYEDVCSKDSAISSPKTDTLDTLSLDFRERDFASLAGDAEPLNPLSDLSGDYDSHIRSLLYGQCIHGFTLSAPVVPNSPSSPSQFRSKKPWDTVRRSMPLRRNSFSQTNSNSVYTGPPLGSAGNSAPSVAALDSGDKWKAKGTGTYFPSVNCFCTERPSQGGRARNKKLGSYCQFQRHSRKNGSSPVLSETSSSENGSYEVPNSRSSVLGHWKSGVTTQSNCSVRAETRVNGFSNASGRLEFGSLGNLPEILLSGSSHTRGSNPSLSVKGKFLKSVQGNEERVAEQSFHLKNEEEFPPLSV